MIRRQLFERRFIELVLNRFSLRTEFQGPFPCRTVVRIDLCRDPLRIDFHFRLIDSAEKFADVGAAVSVFRISFERLFKIGICLMFFLKKLQRVIEGIVLVSREKISLEPHRFSDAVKQSKHCPGLAFSVAPLFH